MAAGDLAAMSGRESETNGKPMVNGFRENLPLGFLNFSQWQFFRNQWQPKTKKKCSQFFSEVSYNFIPFFIGEGDFLTPQPLNCNKLQRHAATVQRTTGNFLPWILLISKSEFFSCYPILHLQIFVKKTMCSASEQSLSFRSSSVNNGPGP